MSRIPKEEQAKILAFIQKCKIGVISTIHANGDPESAVVGVSETESLELIFDTLPETRKYKNLQSNSQVAFVIGWDGGTVQYEGVARELAGDEKHEAITIHITKLSGEMAYIERGAAVFKVSPTWIRFSDFTSDSPQIFEASL